MTEGTLRYGHELGKADRDPQRESGRLLDWRLRRFRAVRDPVGEFSSVPPDLLATADEMIE